MNRILGKLLKMIGGLVDIQEKPISVRWAEVRRVRGVLLVASDWTQLTDANLSEFERANWASYRQALRDLPQSAEAPEDVVLPSPPG